MLAGSESDQFNTSPSEMIGMILFSTRGWKFVTDLSVALLKTELSTCVPVYYMHMFDLVPNAKFSEIFQNKFSEVKLFV